LHHGFQQTLPTLRTCMSNVMLRVAIVSRSPFITLMRGGTYADGFDVLGAKGERLTRRILRHPHVDEQPFTRIRGGVRLPETLQAVTVRARCSVHGFVGKKVGVMLPTH